MELWLPDESVKQALQANGGTSQMVQVDHSRQQ
jgi:hypothetical protein